MRKDDDNSCNKRKDKRCICAFARGRMTHAETRKKEEWVKVRIRVRVRNRFNMCAFARGRMSHVVIRKKEEDNRLQEKEIKQEYVRNKIKTDGVQ